MLSGLILAAATGDVSSLASGLPAVLIEMHYSRGHETEADLFALDAMQKACLPPKAFADILERLEHQTEAKEGGNQDVKTSRPKDAHSVNEMLSSHPDMQARIKPFLVAKQDCGQKRQPKI
jgi:Zn-dependent protease with chaperone function